METIINGKYEVQVIKNEELGDWEWAAIDIAEDWVVDWGRSCKSKEEAYHEAMEVVMSIK